MNPITITPLPKSLVWNEGAFAYGNHVTMSVHHVFPANRQSLLRTLWSRFSMTGSNLEIAQNDLLPDCCALIANGTIPALNAEDEYAVEVTPAGIGLAARDEIGLMHAFYSLIQAIDPINLNYGEELLEIPCLSIHDHPSIALRSFHICVFPETTLSLLEKSFSLAGLLKCSHIVLEFWGTLQYDALPEMAWNGHSYAKHQIRPLIELANSFGMEVIPMTNHLGHASQSRGGMGKHTMLDQNPRLATLFEPDGWTWCLSNPQVHTLLRRFREELIELCGPGSYFHLGCDEAYSYASCRRCMGKDRVQMLADYLNGLAQELDEQGRRGIIWGDQFLDRTAWERPVIATSRPDQKTHLALEKLDRRLIIGDWQYNISEGDMPTGRYFKEKGFTTVMCPWDRDEYKNTLALANVTEKDHLDGIMVTTWHHLPEMTRFFHQHMEAAWNASAFTNQGDPLHIVAPLIRKLTAKPTLFEHCGFVPREVDHTYGG